VTGMLLSGDPTFESIGLGTMVVVGCAIVGSLTVLPALMYKLGDRVERGRIPLLSRLRGPSGSDSRLWGAVLDVTLNRPALSAAVCNRAARRRLGSSLLPADEVPVDHDLPRSIPIVRTLTSLNEAFPGTSVPAVIVVKAPERQHSADLQGKSRGCGARLWLRGSSHCPSRWRATRRARSHA